MDMPYKPVEYTIVRTVKCVWLVKEWNKLNEPCLTLWLRCPASTHMYWLHKATRNGDKGHLDSDICSTN